jgi:hypothetical protein
MAVALAGAGCASQSGQPAAPDAGRPDSRTEASAVNNLAIMPVWTVPSGAFKVGAAGFVEVRLTPQQDLPNAILSAMSYDAGLVIEAPDRLSLAGLRKFNDAPQSQPRRPDELPALGITIIRSFRVMAKAPGHFRVRVELRDGGRMQYRDIFIDAE